MEVIIMIRKLFLTSALLAVTLGITTLVVQVRAFGAADAEVHKAEAATGAVAEQLARGEGLFKTHCSGCHQANGQGLPGAFPPLAGSDYLLADRRRAIETVIQGKSGPITVNGQEYNGVMPGMGYLADDEVADIITYALNS
jgi:mono/diheme cytochrome c family protein